MNIAVDLGGTNIRVAAVENGVIQKYICEDCKSGSSEQEVIDHLKGMINAMPLKEARGIGIGVPSIVDTKNGIVYDVTGIPSWKEVHLKEILEKTFGLPVCVNNDCNCFALGVCRFGEGKGFKEIVCVTLGTGVGGSLVVDGKLYEGNNTGAGEIGSVQYLDKDYEFYCSSRFFVSRGTTGKEANIKAIAGDRSAIALWNEFGSHIGELVKLIMFTYDPAAIVFGGSIASAYNLFESSMRKSIDTFPYKNSISRLMVCTSTLESPGILGASLLCS